MPLAEVNGTSLHYEFSGDGERTLVLLNGIFQRTEAWEKLLPQLRGFRVLRYDMRGQGQSDVPPGAYTPDLHADDLASLLATLGVERYGILGLSNGGIVAQVHAARQASGLERAVIACTTPLLDPLLRAKVEGWRIALDLGGTPARLRVAQGWVWGRAFLEQYPQVSSDAGIEAALAIAPTEEAQRNLLDGFFTLSDLRPRLAKVTAPCLVVSGEDDLLFPPHYGRLIADAIPGARFVSLPELGHAAPMEDPRAFAAAVLPFLAN
ncbi:MAG TPA: alpha/beta hydrolase [Deinococcales bacterium]|nr:alpha/beta hydrolase [Deinococcales bacterium]